MDRLLARAHRLLRAAWTRRGWGACALWPLSCLYGALLALHRLPWGLGLRRPWRADVPVLVVGNVVAGGAGKTPVTLALVAHLRARGWRPGVISRGHGRQGGDCREVLLESAAHEVGDEPLLLARAANVPVFVARRRVQAAQALRQRYPEVNIILSDDGLQHLPLGRDVELCVFPGGGVGNGWLLPAGPLRAPWPQTVSAVLHAGAQPPPKTAAPAFAMRRSLAPVARNAQGQSMALRELAATRGGVEAVAATACPEEFFAMLTQCGIPLQHTQALPDHYNFRRFCRLGPPQTPLLCTEKDAVKLWHTHPQAWAVALHVQLPEAFWALLDEHLAICARA